MLTVTKVQLTKQLAEGSATTINGECQEWVDPTMRVLTEDGPRTAQQTVHYLEFHQWIDNLYVTCDTPGCLRMDHITDDKAKADAVKDEELMHLVQRTSVTLADLYRKGKARGLLTSGTAYN